MQNKKVTHIKLTDTLEDTIIKEIEDGMSMIQLKRDEISFEKRVQADKDFYAGIMSANKWGPWAGSAKYFMKIGATHIDIVAGIALRQSLGIHPIIQMEADDVEIENPEILRDREDLQDKRLRNKIKIEKLLKAGVLREACIHGVSFVKVCYTANTNVLTKGKTYTPEQLEEYRTDSANYGQSEQDIDANINQLETGETIEIPVDNEKDGYSGSKAYRVKIEDFFARPDIRDLDKQRLVTERLHYTWSDIQEHIDNGYYNKAAKDKLLDKYEDMAFERDYELHECILYAKLFKKWQKFVITYEPESKTICRAIYFPMEHGKCYYVPYYIKERDDSLYGYSMRDMIGQNNDYINDVMNGLLDRSSLDNNPAKRVSLKAAKSAAAVSWGPDALYVSNEEIQILNTQNRSVDGESILGILNSMLQTTDGVNAEVLSGQTAPNDPTGPAAKQAMQTQASNFRIEDYIISLQQSNEELSYLVEETEKQYGDIPDSEMMKIPVRHIAHGTSLSINKMQQVAILKDYLATMMQIAPDVVQSAEWRRKWLIMYVNNIGGVVENKKKDLIPEAIGNMAQQTEGTPPNIEEAVNNMTDEELESIEALGAQQ